jgi:ABC-type dipeptide/oligopeptide/nickel transport system ATPase component
MIFQEPMTALNPVMRVGDQIAETFRCTAAGPPSVRDACWSCWNTSACRTPQVLRHAYPPSSLAASGSA